MASTETPESQGRQPISPQKRRILQQCFERGTKVAASASFDYATDLFCQCVNGDPGNVIYVQSYIGNLQKKYNNNKKGSKLAVIKGAGTKTSLKKATLSKDWSAAIKQGLEVLKLNPWDITALTSLAHACEALDHDECQLTYLQFALEADLKDAEVNRQFARALEAQGQYDRAMVCWRHVLQAKAGDVEAQKGINNCTVKKTIHDGGYEDAESSKDVATDGAAEDEGPQLSPVEQLEKAIKKNPEEVANYLELGSLHAREDRLDEAEEVLQRALEASGGKIGIREKLEEIQMLKIRQQLMLAERRAHEEKSKAAVELYKKLRDDVNAKELDVYRSRVERYPTNIHFKFELAERLKRAEQFTEAIRLYQEARHEPRRKGKVLLSLGECFHHIKQHKLALKHYEDAIGAIPDDQQDDKKLALYRAGKLAVGLKDADLAEKHLNELAAIDFSYRDVAALLDKINQIHDDA